MTSVMSEICRFQKIEYLESMRASELAFWLINSFTPERFRAGNKDVIETAIRILYQRSLDKMLIVEFVDRLWGMHGMVPDYSPEIFRGNVVSFRRSGK